MRVMTRPEDWEAAIAAGHQPVSDPDAGAFFFADTPDPDTLDALDALGAVVICPIAGLAEETDFATWLLGYRARRDKVRRSVLAGREKAIAEGRYNPTNTRIDFATQAFIRNCLSRKISIAQTARLAGVCAKTVTRIKKKMER